MKILHLSSEITWRGGEQQIAWLIQELKALNHESLVFCPRGSYLARHCRLNNISYSPYNKRLGVSITVAKQYSNIVDNFNPDVVHIHDSNSQTTTLLAWIFFSKCPLLILSRRVDFPIATNFISNWKYNHKSIRKIICVSRAVANIVSSKIEKKDKIVIIRDGIDLTRFPSLPTGHLKSIVDAKSDTQIIGNIAALADHKDHVTFIKTAVLVSHEFPTAKFVIIGEDLGELPNLQQLVIDLDLTKKVYFLGFRNDIELLIKDIDVFLFTSKTEGSGSAIMDAMAAGIPIVATEAGGISEFIQHNKNGWLTSIESETDLAKGVIFALRNPAKAQKWVTESKEMVKNYSILKMTQDTLCIYESVIYNNNLA